MHKKATCFTVAVIGLAPWICTSCDTDWALPSLRPPNFVWSERHGQAPEQVADAYFVQDGPRYWVIVQLIRAFLPPVTGRQGEVVLLCVARNTSSSTSEVEFRTGIAILSSFYNIDSKRTLERIRLLRGSGFQADLRGPLRIAYEGTVLPVSLAVSTEGAQVPYLMPDKGEDFLWLKFDVKAKKDRKKVVRTFMKLHPLLAQQDAAKELVECFTPLLHTEK